MGASDNLRKQAFDQIVDGLSQFSTDEMLAFREIVVRTNVARPKYGPYVAHNDDRDFRQEYAQELADCIAYMAMHVVGREARRQERLKCFDADKRIAPVMRGLDEVARVGVEEID